LEDCRALNETVNETAASGYIPGTQPIVSTQTLVWCLYTNKSQAAAVITLNIGLQTSGKQKLCKMLSLYEADARSKEKVMSVFLELLFKVEKAYGQANVLLRMHSTSLPTSEVTGGHWQAIQSEGQQPWQIGPQTIEGKPRI
jgi:hypothetical protein